MKDNIAIKTKSLNKSFGKNKDIIRSVDLEVRKGELFCMVGANGAGKTTLIKILCGLILPTKGEVFINGHNMLSDPDAARSSIGLVTGDERSFYWRLTGRQNLDFFATLHNLRPPEKNRKIEELLDILRIENPDNRFQEYPSGVKQRLSIARALLSDPAVLFMDELTKNLDHASAKGLRAFIKESLVKKQGKTVFFSTHHLYEVEELADRVAFMIKGGIFAMGTLKELKEATGIPGADIERVYDYFTEDK